MGKCQREQEEYVVAMRSIRRRRYCWLLQQQQQQQQQQSCTALALFCDSVQLQSHKAIFLVIYGGHRVNGICCPCPSCLAFIYLFIYLFLGFLLVTDWGRCPWSMCRTWCFGKIPYPTAVITGPGGRAAPGA